MGHPTKIKLFLLTGLKWLLRLAGLLLLLLLLLAIVMQFPAVQTYLTNRVAGAITAGTGAEASVDRVILRLPGTLTLKRLSVKDATGDTLLYGEKIGIRVRLLALRKNHLDVRSIHLKGIVANVYRLANDDRFNFEMLFSNQKHESGFYNDASIAEIDVDQEYMTDTLSRESQWTYSLGRLTIEGVRINYNDYNSGMDVHFSLQRLDFEPEEIAPEQLRFHAKALLLERPELLLSTGERGSEPPEKEPAPFEMPAVDILLQRLAINDLTVHLHDRVSGSLSQLETSISILGLVARHDTLGLDFYASGSLIDDAMQIQEASFQLAAGQAISLEELRLQTTYSTLHAGLYSPVSLFETGMPGMENPHVEIHLHQAVVGEDLAGIVFGESVAQQFFGGQKKLTAMAKASGRLDDVRIEQLAISYDELANLEVVGEITGLPHVSQTIFSLPDVRLQLSEAIWSDETIGSMVSDALSLSGDVLLEAAFQGSLSDWHTTAMVSGPLGQMELDGSYRKEPASLPLYDLQLGVKDLLVGTIFGVASVESGVTASLHVNGKGTEPTTAEASFMLSVDEVRANQYLYKGLTIEGDFWESQLTLSANYHDEALSFGLNGMADIGREHPHLKMLVDLFHLDAQALHLSADPMMLKTKFDADVVLSEIDFFEGNVGLLATVLELNGMTYNLDSITLETNTSVVDSVPLYQLALRSRIFEASYSGNMSPVGLPHIMSRHFASYLEWPDAQQEQTTEQVILDFDIRVIPSRWYTQVFFPELHSFEEISVVGSFSSESDAFIMQGELPSVVYGEIGLNQMTIQAVTERHKADLLVDVGVLELNDNIFRELRLDSQVEENMMLLRLFAGGRFNEPWMHARGNLSEMELLFETADLASLFQDDGINRVMGILDGNITVGNFLEEQYFLKADLQIDHLGLNDEIIGDLSLNMQKPLELSQFVFRAALRNHGNRLDIDGTYIMDEEDHLDLNLGIDRFDLSVLEGFTGGELQQLEGLMSGQVRLNGTLSNLNYAGELHLNGVRFLAAFANTTFGLPDESIYFDRDHLSFHDFNVYDAQGRRATLSGRVVTTDWRNPVFHLSLVSRNFLSLEVPPGQNDQFSGRVFISSDLRLHGDLQRPSLDGNLKLNEGTHFLIKVPQTMPEAVGDEGVVLFVGPDSVVRSTTPVASDPLTTSLRNLNISINVEVDPATDVRIVIDEHAGDFLEVKGGGMISYGTDPGGRIRLSGRYELVQGTYLLTFYDILSREFHIVGGSHIIWSGDPMNPDVDLTAIYQVRTTPRELFESTSATMGGHDIPGLRQQFPFEVVLKMTGPMMRPEINFGIRLPPEHRQALDGRLQSRLEELERNESALNKQVFALLTFGHFMAENPFASALEGPGFSATARTSASRLLTQQLNRLSDQYIRGVDIHFDIESFQDDTEAGLQGRTQLNLEVSKNFFDERVRVTVGGNIELEDDTRRQTSAGDIAGDFLIEYFLNEQGNLVLKGFRKKEFGDLFEGQVIETGVALLFNKTYNRFRELFGRKEEELGTGDW